MRRRALSHLARIITRLRRQAAEVNAEPFWPVPMAYMRSLLPDLGFDPDTYLAMNGDLAVVLPSPAAALDHFLEHGCREHRAFPIRLYPGALTRISELDVADRDRKVALLATLALNHVNADPGQAPACAASDSIFQEVLACGAQPYILIGDSHTNLYRSTIPIDGKWLLPLHLICSGGSALGLANPQSRSGYGSTIKGFIRSLDGVCTNLPIVIKFGQVDVEFVFDFRRSRGVNHLFFREDFDSFADHSLKRYSNFLECTFKPTGRRRVFVASINPPALGQAVLEAGYINGHIASLENYDDLILLREALASLKFASLSERVDMHRDYNIKIRDCCRRAGFTYLDDFSLFCVGERILPSMNPITHGKDHHIDRTQENFSKIGDKLLATLLPFLL